MGASADRLLLVLWTFRYTLGLTSLSQAKTGTFSGGTEWCRHFLSPLQSFAHIPHGAMVV